MKRLLTALTVALLLVPAMFAQATGVMPVPRLQFFDGNGNPLSGGCVFTYDAGTSNPHVTYADSTTSVPNADPVILDAGGWAPIWLDPSLYRVVVKSAGGINCVTGSVISTTDNLANTGLRALTLAVLLNPSGGAEQTVSGPVAATYFHGTTAHTTSPGVRSALLDPLTVLDSNNPPNMITMPPAAPNQNYRIPDPLGHANYVLSPDPSQTGTNTLDCTLSGISCKRYGFVYFEGGGCNGSTSGLGWDTFSTSAPTPICITGTNVQKGVMAMPSAATKVQENTGTGAAAGTCTTTYPAATSTGDFLVAGVVVDGGKTVTGITDGTNAYTSAVTAANGNTRLEVWYFNGNSAAKAAGTTLTVTLSAAANCAIDWLSYKDVLTAGALDVTQSLTGTGTSVSTGGSGGTTVPVELILSFVGTPSNPSISYQAGHVGHATVSQSTNITISSQGVIQQLTSPQSGNFTLGSSQAWVAALATFKANVGVTTQAQRHVKLPPTFVSTIPINAPVSWQAPLTPTGVVNVKLGAAVVCTQDGSTDDPAFPTFTSTTVPVNASSANAITTTTLSNLTSTGCAPNSLMHLQIQRQRYEANDTYEGYVYVNGVGLQLGVQ